MNEDQSSEQLRAEIARLQAENKELRELRELQVGVRQHEEAAQRQK